MTIRLTPAVKALLIVCFISFLIQHTGDRWFGTDFASLFGLVPRGVLHYHRYWQFLTYVFLHADPMHLFFNLLLLAFVGSELEMVWGPKQFLKFYFFCSISAGLIYFILQIGFIGGLGSHLPLIGASGAIYGLLMAFGLLFGEKVMLFMLLFPMKAKHFVIFLGLFELMTTFYSSGGGVGSISHLGGMVAGFLYLWGRTRLILYQKSRKLLPKRGGRLSLFAKRKTKHLKLVVSNQPPQGSNPDRDSKPKLWH